MVRRDGHFSSTVPQCSEQNILRGTKPLENKGALQPGFVQLELPQFEFHYLIVLESTEKNLYCGIHF